MNDDKDERAAFEAWASKEGFGDKYRDFMFEAWKGGRDALASQASKGAAIGKGDDDLCGLTNAQLTALLADKHHTICLYRDALRGKGIQEPDQASKVMQAHGELVSLVAELLEPEAKGATNFPTQWAIDGLRNLLVAQAQPVADAAPVEAKPFGWLTGNTGDGGYWEFSTSYEYAKRECDEHNAYERSRDDFDPSDHVDRVPEPLYMHPPKI